jgi:hypothetical protein
MGRDRPAFASLDPVDTFSGGLLGQMKEGFMQLPRRHHGRHAGPQMRGSVVRSAAQMLIPGDRPLRPMRGYLGRAGIRMLTRTLVAAAVLIGLANLSTSTHVPTGPAAAPPNPAQMELMERFNCSPDGFGDGSTPRSAIIRSEEGLQVVSFDRGWEIYTGTRPHALVAVCHDPPR